LLFVQLKEELSVHGSDEEIDDPPEAGSEDDLSDDNDKEVLEELCISYVHQSNKPRAYIES
jgi:hypothetical protein